MLNKAYKWIVGALAAVPGIVPNGFVTLPNNCARVCGSCSYTCAPLVIAAGCIGITYLLQRLATEVPCGWREAGNCSEK